jgi:ABC-type amino acid transport substrate-binding protein
MSNEILRWAVNQSFNEPPYIEVQREWPTMADAKETLQSKTDGWFPYVRTRARKNKGLIFSEPLHPMRVDVFVRTDDPLEDYEGIADLHGRTACKPQGYYMKDLRRLVEGGTVELLAPKPETAASCMEALQDGEADFVSINPHVAQGAIRRSEATANQIRSAGPHTRVNLHVMAADTPSGRAFLDQLDKTLIDMRKRGTLQAISERHRRMYAQ